MKNFSFIIKKLKLNKNRPLLRSLSLLLATAMVFSVAVWAWFSTRKDADANGIDITLGTSKNLSMSLDNGETFHGAIDLLNADHQQHIIETNRIKDKLFMYDITSDGDTFWSPKFKDANDGIRTPDTSQAWSQATPNSAYISETIIFRTTFPAEIYMGKNTAINTSAAPDKLVGSNAENKSTNFDFSKDCIVGALRISAIDVQDNNKLCFVCIPRSDIELVEDADGNFSINRNSEAAKRHTYYPDNYQTSGSTATKDAILEFSAVDGGSAPNDSTKITTTVKGNDGNYYGTAIVNIWLEGCDAETRRVLSGGKFNINLDFVAFEIVEATTTEAE